MGDFNLNWEDKIMKKFKQITDGFNLVQMVKGPTRITNSTSTQIDLIFSNRPERITQSYNMITRLSDHNIVLIGAAKTDCIILYRKTSFGQAVFFIQGITSVEFNTTIRESTSFK